MTSPLIQVKNLSKQYEFYRKEAGLRGTLKAFFHRETLFAQAVKNISFEIEEGELVGFLGPNGAGKTTTLKMLSGIIYPTRGSVSVLGFTPQDRKKEYQKQFAIVMGQKNQLLGDLPARESFLLRKVIYEIPDHHYRQTISELTKLLEITDILDIPVRKLSLGQRMKCELLAALLHNPKVLFLDEPTIGLDVIAQKNIRDFIKKYNTLHKTTILLTSHYMGDIKELCKRVIIINLGKIVYDGNLKTLIQQYANYKLLKVTFTQETISQKALEKFGEIVEITEYSCTLKVESSKTKQIAIKLLSSDLPIEDILINEDEIDDVIRRIFSGKRNIR